jgi:hypothetical protein
MAKARNTRNQSRNPRSTPSARDKKEESEKEDRDEKERSPSPDEARMKVDEPAVDTDATDALSSQQKLNQQSKGIFAFCKLWIRQLVLTIWSIFITTFFRRCCKGRRQDMATVETEASD